MRDDPALPPPAVAKHYGVTPQKVLAWIASGQLAAINVGDGAQRPRWRITAEALAAFEQRRAATPAAKPTRRRKQTAGVTEYF